jgi:hypothetical protein
MWVQTKKDYFQIAKEERFELNYKLETLYRQHGHYIQVIENSPWFQDQRAIAYLEFNHMENEMTFKCGTFWYEEDNLCPVVAMTHELGHFIDIKENFDGNWIEYNRTLGTLELEVRAWERGIEFCRQMGILDTYAQMIFDYAERCLDSYFSAWSLPNDRRFNFMGRKPSFEEARHRISNALGLEYKPREVQPPRDDFFESLRRLEELIGERRTVQFNPCGETEEMTPLERVRKRKEKYRETVKKGMNVKPWEL